MPPDPLAAAYAALDAGDPAGALALAQRVLRDDPDCADAHHLAARIHEERGDHDAQVEHDMRVLELDAVADARMGIGSVGDRRFVEARAREVLARLPKRFAERLEGVPVVLEARPGRALVRSGFDPRALGLFEGPDDFGRHAHEPTTVPTRIVVYYANLIATVDDDDALAGQIEVTILHEIGHYFGLDEDAVAELGLE